MELEFKSKNPRQIEAASYWIDDETSEILYGGAKGGGKSYLGVSLIFGDALIYPETHYFIARKELNDLRKHTIPSIHERFKHWGLDIEKYAKFNGQDNVYNLYNGSKVYLIACKEEPSDPLFERFGSMQMTRGWIEEAGEVPEDARANLWLSVGRWKNDEYGLKPKLLNTANPKKGHLKRDFVDPFKSGTLPKSRKYIQAFAEDNTYLSKDYAQKLHSDTNKVRRQRLAEGNWDYDDDNDSLVSSDALDDMFTNTVDTSTEKYLIVDVARLGKDSTVFTFFEGLEAYKVIKKSKQTTDVTEDQIKEFAREDRIPYSHILVDEGGVGGGVIDHLPGVKAFLGGSIPLPTRHSIEERQNKVHHSLVPKTVYSNLKAQCAWKLAELINTHKFAFKVSEYRDEVTEDLSALLRDKNVDSEGRKQLRSKDDVKREIRRSPDIGDTLIMRAWFEVKKDSFNEDPILERQHKEKIDALFHHRRANSRLNSTK